MRFEFLLVVIVGLIAVQLMTAEAQESFNELDDSPNFEERFLDQSAAFAA